tara:strand:- start:2811 stop:3335 length:525 start_codon:yes stop_codon:yes gene_type:complete
MGFLGGPLPGYETEIGLDPGNPDWVAPFTGPVISNPFAQNSEGVQAGDIAGEYLSQYSNPIKGVAAGSGSGSMLDDDSEGGIEKITDGLYLYNPGKFLANYSSGVQGGGGSKSSSGLSGLIKTAAPIAINLGLKSLMGVCDMRLKTDVSPLETTDVNDDLAEMAFFVKGLRECA